MLVKAIAAFIPRLRRFAHALVRDPAAADDLVQDTLERACSRSGQFREGTNLQAWLFSIMHSVFINGLKTPHARASFESIDEDFELPVPDFTRQLELRELIVTALEELSPEHREVLLLVALEDMPYDEAAQVLGVPVGTVKSRVARARSQLTVLMNEAGEGSKALRLVKGATP
jgi:RNA polymerase sigma-70 factor (ECF subfamily)